MAICDPVNKGLKIELTCTTKSPLAPLLRQAQDGESRRTICQRGVISLPFVSDPASGSEEPLARRERSLTRRVKGGEEGFYKTMSLLL